MTALVQLDEVTVRYRDGPLVLQNLTTRFDERAVHVITGPSGCGKSTLLYVVGLMLAPDAGAVSILGTDHARSPDRVRAGVRSDSIGFVFQDALLEPSMTVFDNVLEGVPWNRPLKAFMADARQRLDRLGLAELVDRRASRLSGGQSQRAAFVRAALKNPAILLADEPTGNLDDASAELVLDELFEFGRRPGHVTIIVTHDHRIAERADQVLELAPVAVP